MKDIILKDDVFAQLTTQAFKKTNLILKILRAV